MGLKEGEGRQADGGLPVLAWLEPHQGLAEVPWEQWPPVPQEEALAPREAAASREKRPLWEPEAAGGRRGVGQERWPCGEREV
jgi:hypothetical protein